MTGPAPSRLDRLLDHLAIAPSHGTKLGYLDGVRSVAVLLVVLVHAWFYAGLPAYPVTLPVSGIRLELSRFLGSGFVGVDLFFVLSGFLLSRAWHDAHQLRRPAPSLRQYAWLRFFRIVPAYYACLFLILLFMVPAYIPFEQVYSREGLGGILAHLAFVHFYFPQYQGSYGVDGAMWTLTIEATFYVVLPLVVPFFYGKRWIWPVLGSIGITLAWLYLTRNRLGGLVVFLQHHGGEGLSAGALREFLAEQFPSHLTDFALGIAAQGWLRAAVTGGGDRRMGRLVRNRAVMTWLFVVSVVWLGFSMYRIWAFDSLWFPYYLKGISVAFGFAGLVLGVSAGADLLRRLLAAPPLRFIGIVSYSLFLWHEPLIYIAVSYPEIQALPSGRRFPVILAFALGMGLIVATGSYLAIERPFMIWSRRARVAHLDPNPGAAS